MHMTIEELIHYTAEERSKWHRWFSAYGFVSTGDHDLGLSKSSDLLFQRAGND
jgi:hypothetical protein